MSNQVTKADLSNLEGRIDKRFDDLTALMSQFASDVDSRLSKIETKQMEHDEEFRKQNQKYEHLISTIDGFIGRKTDMKQSWLPATIKSIA